MPRNQYLVEMNHHKIRMRFHSSAAEPSVNSTLIRPHVCYVLPYHASSNGQYFISEMVLPGGIVSLYETERTLLITNLRDSDFDRFDLKSGYAALVNKNSVKGIIAPDSSTLNGLFLGCAIGALNSCRAHC